MMAFWIITTLVSIGIWMLVTFCEIDDIEYITERESLLLMFGVLFSLLPFLNLAIIFFGLYILVEFCLPKIGIRLRIKNPFYRKKD